MKQKFVSNIRMANIFIRTVSRIPSCHRFSLVSSLWFPAMNSVRKSEGVGLSLYRKKFKNVGVSILPNNFSHILSFSNLILIFQKYNIFVDSVFRHIPKRHCHMFTEPINTWTNYNHIQILPKCWCLKDKGPNR